MCRRESCRPHGSRGLLCTWLCRCRIGRDKSGGARSRRSLSQHRATGRFTSHWQACHGRARTRRSHRHRSRGDRSLPSHTGNGGGHRTRDQRRGTGHRLAWALTARLLGLSLTLGELARAHRDRALLAGELGEPVSRLSPPLPQPLHLPRVGEEQQCQDHHANECGGGGDHTEL